MTNSKYEGFSKKKRISKINYGSISNSFKGVYEKIEADKKLKVVYLGNCWIASNKSLKESFIKNIQNVMGDFELQEHNASIPNAFFDSIFLRLKEDVLNENPDLLVISAFVKKPFICKTSLPSYNLDQYHYLEAIIRMAINANPKIGIIVLPCIHFNREEMYEHSSMLVEKYDVCLLPTKDIIDEVLIDNDKEQIFKDAQHFTPLGYKEISFYIMDILEKIYDIHKLSYLKLPNSKIYEDTYDSVKFLYGEDLSCCCNWQSIVKKSDILDTIDRRKLFICEKTDEPLEIELYGKDFIFWFGDKSKGFINIEINGQLYMLQMRLYEEKNSNKSSIYDSITIGQKNCSMKKIKIYMPDNQPTEDYKLEFWGMGMCENNMQIENKKIGFYSVFSEDIFDDNICCEEDASNWLFIIGPMRTGTTVLAKNIHRHPKCVVHNEAKFLVFFKSLLQSIYLRSSNAPFYTQWDISPFEEETDTNSSCSLANFNAIDSNMRIFINETYKQYKGVVFDYNDLRRYSEAYRGCFTKDACVTLFGEKNPLYLSMYNDIFKTFPNPKIILTRRNLMDVVASHYDKIASGSCDDKDGYFSIDNVVLFICQRIKSVLSNLQKVSEIESFCKKNSMHYCLAEYEKIAKEPQKQYEIIFDYLKVNSDQYDWNQFEHHYSRNLYNWRDRLPNKETEQAIEKIREDDRFKDLFEEEFAKSEM